MTEPTRPRLCVCYIHGLDKRHIHEADAPFLSSLLARGDTAIVETFPSNELVSTVFTGAWPHEHGLWQAALRPGVEKGEPGVLGRLADALPDMLTTTAQLVRYQFDKSYELPVVPPRRRRRLEFHRFKYYTWARSGRGIHKVGGYTTLFDVLGDRCRFQFAKDMTGTRRALQAAPSGGGIDVDFIQTYALDQLEHWGLDRPDLVAKGLREIDGWLADAAQRCADAGVNMLIFSDHGQEAVTGYVDLKKHLRDWGVHDDDCTYLIEAQCARFWFHNDATRAAVVPKLREIPHTKLIDNAGLTAFGLHFKDHRYGELYLFTDQGHVYFPHDFYHPVANLFMGLTEREVMAPRRRDPRHRGYHGHLPPHPAEEGLLVMTTPGWRRTTERAKLIDIAPTVLSLVGAERADTMKGTAVFEQ